LVALTLGVVALSMSGAASAGQAISVSGTYVVSDIGIPACAPLGSSGFMFRCTDTGLTSDYSGDLTGSAVADLTEIVNCKTGRTNGTATETFTGSIDVLPLERLPESTSSRPTSIARSSSRSTWTSTRSP